MTFQHALAGARLGQRLFAAPERAGEVLRAAWPEVVGPELARRTEVVALEGRCLWVRVPDVGWRKVLHRMRGEIRRRLRARAGDLAPSQLAFVLGPVPLPPADPPPGAAIRPGPRPRPGRRAGGQRVDPRSGAAPPVSRNGSALSASNHHGASERCLKPSSSPPSASPPAASSAR